MVYTKTIIHLSVSESGVYLPPLRWIIVNYYTLKSLSLFWLAESVQWIFEISTGDVITADFTIIMSRTLYVGDWNHVMYDRGAWFLMVIMSSLCALWCLSLVKKQKHYFFLFCSMYNKTVIRFGFCDIQNNQGLSKGYQPQSSVDSTYLDLDYFGYHKKPHPIIFYHYY